MWTILTLTASDRDEHFYPNTINYTILITKLCNLSLNKTSNISLIIHSYIMLNYLDYIW